MSIEFYKKERHAPADAKFVAQKIAFAPFVFQAAWALRELGVLAAVEAHGHRGASVDELAQELDLPPYGVKVLLEAGAGADLLLYDDERYSLANTGYYILHDAMTRVNMNFVQDVNYRGLAHLETAVRTGMPEGLKELGAWRTIYQALTSLPARVQESWLAFDHYYSDLAFRSALPIVFRERPRRLLDVGGNTGRWALACLSYDRTVHVTIADLPGQVRIARANLEGTPASERISYWAMDVLNTAASFPSGCDAIWMSQFLDCFSPGEIVFILKRLARVMKNADSLYILETYQDRQQYEAASFCLQQTSLYFACMANGNSRMYHSSDMHECLDAAGFEVVEDTDKCGISHTLFKCMKKK